MRTATTTTTCSSAIVLTRAATNSTRAKAANAPFRILHLPPELAGNICNQLDDGDLLSVSQAFVAHSSTAYGKRFFHHLIAILHPASFIVLLEISRHATWFKFVGKVTISGELIGITLFAEDTDIWPHISLQRSAKNSGMDHLILKEVFRALTSLKDIRIDVASFNAAEGYGFDADCIKCGRIHLFIDPDEPAKPSQGPERPCTRIYQLLQGPAAGRHSRKGQAVPPVLLHQ